MTKTNYLIEIEHSKWGKIKLKMNIESKNEICFYYLDSGNFMGGWDREMGGTLGHPNESVDKFIRSYGLNLMDFDYCGYCQLEDLLKVEVMKLFPRFFKKGI